MELYHSQRAMRAMRSAALQRGVIAVLDVGTSKIGCLILKFDGTEEKIDGDGVGSLAGQSGFQVIGSAITKSRGIEYGEIVSMPETERAIRTALQSAQKLANSRVDHVIACVSGGSPCSYGLEGGIDIKSEIVNDKDIADVLGSCGIPAFEPDREILHAQPVNFSLDHRTGLSDPRGQIGKYLSVDMHMLTIKEKTIQDLAYCVKRCDLELAGVASSSYMSALSSLVEDEKELGAACIDLGGGSTNISIFWKKHMIFAETIKMGGELVTRDVSMGLQIPLSTAERIKTRNGGVVATGLDDREMIEIANETGDWELDRRIISRSDLIGIIRPRIEEILEETRTCLSNAGFDDLPSQKIILTGGASQVPGIDTLANKILGQQVRLGRPMRIHRLPQAFSGANCAGLVGLSIFAAHPQDEWWDFSPRSKNFSGQSVSRVFRWFKDNW